MLHFPFKLRAAFPKYSSTFETRWAAWINATSSVPDRASWTSLPEFEALVALGPKIIPLTLSKMWETGIAPAILLYNMLDKDADYQLPQDGDQDSLNVLADDILLFNFARYRETRNALLDWAEHCSWNSGLSSSTLAYVECEEYYTLLEMGPFIIPQLMLQYEEVLEPPTPYISEANGGGPHAPLFSYELLHELTWGYKCEFRTIFTDIQCKEWADWFENGEHRQAPHFKWKEDRDDW
ncbi:hypothetical protein QBC35DRAFT_396473 [Podospora australis]|uniref:Uncharacterized protein n=1 Tax=Podospora australis TaxID=1536484 RepID=A0AAN6WHV8_9PEZI|nr:hypothetical protein QBC35DRAFT_396473 [Podospora australis]